MTFCAVRWRCLSAFSLYAPFSLLSRRSRAAWSNWTTCLWHAAGSVLQLLHAGRNLLGEIEQGAHDGETVNGLRTYRATLSFPLYASCFLFAWTSRVPWSNCTTCLRKAAGSVYQLLDGGRNHHAEIEQDAHDGETGCVPPKYIMNVVKPICLHSKYTFNMP